MSFVFEGHFQDSSLASKGCLLTKRAYFGKDLFLKIGGIHCSGSTFEHLGSVSPT